MLAPNGSRRVMPNPTEWEQKVDRYFNTHYPWGNPNRRPSDIGSTCTSNYDPTFGDDGLSLGTNLFECLVCGSAVADWRKHIDWHEGTTTS